MSTLHPKQKKEAAPLCRFVELPGELRNRIYRYALVKDSLIDVKADGYERSSLLSTCKEIRQECIKIYYYENEFNIHFDNYDSTTCLKFEECTTGKLDLIPSSIHVHISGVLRPNWPNLMVWLKRLWRGEISVPPGSTKLLVDLGRKDQKHFVVAGLGEIVVEMFDMPWARVKRLLDKQRPVLINLDEKWGED